MWALKDLSATSGLICNLTFTPCKVPSSFEKTEARFLAKQQVLLDTSLICLEKAVNIISASCNYSQQHSLRSLTQVTITFSNRCIK